MREDAERNPGCRQSYDAAFLLDYVANAGSAVVHGELDAGLVGMRLRDVGVWRNSMAICLQKRSPSGVRSLPAPALFCAGSFDYAAFRVRLISHSRNSSSSK